MLNADKCTAEVKRQMTASGLTVGKLCEKLPQLELAKLQIKAEVINYQLAKV